MSKKPGEDKKIKADINVFMVFRWIVHKKNSSNDLSAILHPDTGTPLLVHTIPLSETYHPYHHQARY